MNGPRLVFFVMFHCGNCGVVAALEFPAGDFTGQLPDAPPPLFPCPRCGVDDWRSASNEAGARSASSLIQRVCALCGQPMSAVHQCKGTAAQEETTP